MIRDLELGIFRGKFWGKFCGTFFGGRGWGWGGEVCARPGEAVTPQPDHPYKPPTNPYQPLLTPTNPCSSRP